MDEKKLEAKMEEHLSNTRWDIRVALQRFQEYGVKIDRRFRREFIKRTTDCIISTCDRYDGSRYKSARKERSDELKCLEKKISKHHQSSKESDSNGERGSQKETKKSSPRRKHENDGHIEVSESKRSKTTDEIDGTILKCSTEILNDVQQEHPKFFFYCAHCLDGNESGDWIGGAIEDVYIHWQLSHVISKPFRFYVAQTAVCQFGDAIGTYSELMKHQQQVHPNDIPAVVCYDDPKKCGICLKSVDVMHEHFEMEHKAITKKRLFNPMRMSDASLDELMKIEIHKKRQCGHCDAIFETENEIDIHHSIGHENMEKISIPYIDNGNPFLICGYCHHKIDREHYLMHIKSHPYVFKCWNCLYESKDLVDLVLHDQKMHDRNTLDYHCSVFPDWLNGFYNNTKMVFPNGLVLRNYNLIGTKFDDSKMFDVYIDGAVELLRSKFALISKKKRNLDNEGEDDGITSPVDPAEDPQFLQNELKKQNELVNSLLLIKMPRMSNMSLPNMFLRLCDKLEVKISGDDIQSIQRRGHEARDITEMPDIRDGRHDVLVTLKRHELKEEIRLAAQKQSIFSGEVFDLHPDEWSKQIKVISHTTRYYSDMLAIAREARLDRTIHNYELTKHGIHIKRSPTSDDRIFISKNELIHFIKRIRYE